MSKEQLTLGNFLDQEGIPNVARMLKCTRQRLYFWKNLEAVPTMKTAFQLLVLSQYKLTLDGIYGPYLQKKYGGKKFKANMAGREVQLEFRF